MCCQWLAIGSGWQLVAGIVVLVAVAVGGGVVAVGCGFVGGGGCVSGW